MLNKQKKRAVASARIKELFFQAELIFHSDKELSNRYVTLARKISMRSKVTIPSELKRRYCHNCYHFLVPGENVRIRTREGKKIYYCLDCKHFMRVMLR